MKSETLSLRQVMVLLFAAGLPAAVDLLPGIAAQTAGGAGWLLPVGALPLLLFALWAQKGMRGNTIIYIMYMALTLFLLMVALRFCAARLEGIWGKLPSAVCAVLLLGLALWMCRGKQAAFARAAEIVYLAIAVVLAGVIVLGLFRMEPENLAVSAPEAAGLPWGVLAAAGIILNVCPAWVMGENVAPHSLNGRRAVGWTAAFCAAAALLLAVILGCLGPGLTAKLPAPFLLLVQGIGVKGAFQRMEAPVAALWLAADFVLIGLLLHSWRGMARRLRPGKWERGSLWAAAAAGLAGGLLLFPDMDRFKEICFAVLPVTGILFGLIVPLIYRIFSGKQKG